MQRLRSWFGACCLAVFFYLASPSEAMAQEEAPEKASRPLHVVLQAGGYVALGGPTPWGSSLSVDLLPGSFAGRYGIRGEWRGYRDEGSGSAIVGAIFEAGASRPQLALKLIAEGGLTSDRRPLVGGGIEWSLWVLGPVGLSTLTDLQIIFDGTGTRPALSATLCLHLGR